MNKNKLNITDEVMGRMLKDQQDEITAHHLYKKIATRIKDPANRQIVEQVSKDELSHYQRLRQYTQKDLKPETLKIFFFYWMSIILGITFVIKLLEKGESQAIVNYQQDEEVIDLMKPIIEDEQEHEAKLIAMIDEERLSYVGSIVLGLNDALVELTGALAGYTFAFQDTKLIALTGLITGISASFSMAASEYLSTRQEGGENAGKSSLYTGIAYVVTVMILVAPYLIFSNPFLSLGVTLFSAVVVIFLFNYYISVAKDYNFKRRFLEMAVISLGVAGISFLIGVLIKQFIGVDI